MNWYKTASKIVGVIRRILTEKLDLLQQDTDYTCGNSVIQNLFRILHKQIPSEADLAKAMKTTSELGTAPQAIEAYMKSVGLPVIRFVPTQSLEDVLAKNAVVIVEYQDYQESRPVEVVQQVQSSHYAIVVGYDEQYFYLVDSYLPHAENTNSKVKKIPKEKFLRDWKARSFDGSAVVKQYGLIIPT
jgi:predicted double-glycine peptidase